MAKTKDAAGGIGNGEILAEIRLIDLIQRIETKLVIQPNTIRFAELADAYIGIGNYDEAIRLCTEGLSHYPNYGPAHLVLARAYYRSGNKAKAREILEAYLNVSPANSSAHKLLGDIALEADDIKSAVTRYRTALRMDPINREVIQQLVDLKDAYQKVKDSGDEDEPADAKPFVAEKPPAPVTEKKKAIPTPAAETRKEAAPTVVKDEAKDAEAELLIRHDLVEVAARSKKTADVAEETPVETKTPREIPKKKEEPAPVVTPPKPVEPAVVKSPASSDELGGLIPSYTDAQGKHYFCVDDELSFAEYKKRKALIDAGKAVLMSRAELDDLMSRAAPPKKPKAAAKEDVAEKAPKAKKEKPVVEETVAPSDGETLLSLDEQEAALDELEISYKDYLDILTDESLLMEALFTEEEPYGALEEQDLSLVSKLAGELPDTPISYHDYLSGLTDFSERREAELADDEKALSLAEYSASVDDEPMDFHAFLMTAPDAAAIEASLARVETEPEMTYAEYLDAVPEPLKKEASLEEPALPATPVVEKPVAPPKPVIKPPEPAVEVPKPKPTPVVKPAAVETIEAEEEIEEEIVEETGEIETTEINPNDATLELVESYVTMGQFGTAYKVCKILKQKNPTDAKIDRKMLELKRLYLWSSQLAG